MHISKLEVGGESVGERLPRHARTHAHTDEHVENIMLPIRSGVAIGLSLIHI